MAFKKILAQRFSRISKFSSQTLTTNCRLSSSSVHARLPPSATNPDIAPDPGDNAIFSRFLHKRPVFQPAFNESLVQKLKTMDIARNRIRLDGLCPPVEEPELTEAVNVEDARKLFKVAQLELVKTSLREIRNSCIPYTELLRICAQHCPDRDQATRIAKMLDDSATVATAIQSLFPVAGGKAVERVRKELEEMEKEKAMIDEKAESMVRRELWGGLGFLAVQTAAFMRLTFWELSWDVMEPICFFVTSIYFMAAYMFFLRTSKEPCFEGFYQSRFSAKQKRLMKLHKFDIARYNELRAASSPSPVSSRIALPFNNSPHY